MFDVVLLVIGCCLISGAIFFNWGRASYRRDIRRAWFMGRCRECGAQPEPRLVHVSGCHAGWPCSRSPIDE